MAQRLVSANSAWRDGPELLDDLLRLCGDLLAHHRHLELTQALLLDDRFDSLGGWNDASCPDYPAAAGRFWQCVDNAIGLVTNAGPESSCPRVVDGYTKSYILG